MRHLLWTGSWRSILTVLLLLCGPSNIFGASGEIHGTLLDSSGAVISGGAVRLRSSGAGVELTTATDAVGRFSFTGLNSGRYILTGCARGFSCASAEASTESEALSLTLEPSGVVESVTVVSASRHEELRDSLNTRVDVIDRARIRDSGHDSVGDVLREVPGVLARRGSETAGTAGEQIQGIDSRQVLVLIDGQPLVGARGVKRGGVLNLDQQSVGRLDRIEVVKGGASALYGSDALGGVINLITREPVSPIEFSASSAYGSNGAFDGRGEMGFVRQPVSGFFSVERQKNNGFDLTPSTWDTTGAGFHRESLLGKIRYQVTPQFSLSALANGYWANQVGRVNGELGPQTSDTDDEQQNYGLTAVWQNSSTTRVEGRAYYARYDEITVGQLAPPRNTPVEPGTLHQRLGKLDATLSQVVGSRQFLQVGGEWWTDRYRGFNRIRDDAGNRADTSVFWFQDRIGLTSRVTLTVGGRYDRHSIFGDAVSPKAAVNLRITDALHARASFGKGFRAPDLGQLFYRFLGSSGYQVIGNPNLRPERGNSWQVGGGYTFARGRVGLNLFRNEVDHLIEAVSLGFITNPGQLAGVMAREGIDPAFRPQLGRLLLFYKNVQSARTQGVELDFDWAPSRWLNFGGAYTYLDAIDKASGLQLTGRHRHQGNIRIGWERAVWGLRSNLRGTFYSDWIAVRAGTADTISPRFAIWDFYAAKQLPRGLEVFGVIDNLANSRDPVVANAGSASPTGAIYRPEFGRTFRVGMRWTLATETR
jgi:outer membrane receptor for ferrienterochelin and colicins